MTIDFDMLRREIRAIDYVRGNPVQDALWREDDAYARASLLIEGRVPSAEDDALFDMLRQERVPLLLSARIILKLLGHPYADPALAITPIGTKRWGRNITRSTQCRD
tara:strand:+ start:1239 stop:1559 length:321 start_codon:yes stop_codon:yes gene_type:complete